jgi:hypothetical protein
MLYGFAGLLVGIALVRVATAQAVPHPADAVIVRAPAPPP